MTQLGVQVVGSTIGLRASLDEAVAAANKWADATEAAGVRSARGLELIGVAAKQAEVAYGKLGIAASRYAEGTVGMEAAAARYQATIEGLYAKQIAMADAAAAAQERSAIRYQNSLRTVGRSWATYISLPLAAVGYESVKLATEFQASMARVQTYAGASGAEVKKMSQDILNSASQLPQGPVKAAEALYHLESIGIRGAHAFAALKASGLAAGAGMADLTDSTTALGGALVADIKGAGDAKTAMAGLISIAGQGNMTMQNLSDALGTGLLVKARDVGISLREVGAAMDVLVDRGIPARRSATYLGSTFALMEAPSAEATKALADMGIQADDMGKMLQQPNGLLNVLNMLQAGVERVGRARGMRDIMDAFGRSRQSTGIQTLVESLNAPVSSFSQKLAGYDKGVGEAAARMAVYQQTAQYKIHTALSQLEADFIKVGRGVSPEIAVGFHAIAMSVDDITKAVEGLPGPVKDGLGALAAILAVGGPVLIGIAGAMKGMRALRNVLAELGIVSKETALSIDTSLATVGPTAAAAAVEADASLEGIGVAGADAATGVEQLDAALAGMAVAARDAALAADASLASVKASAEAAAVSVTELDVAEGAGLGLSAGGALRALGPAALFATTGLIGGQIAEGAIGGETGRVVGHGIEGAGLGASIGFVAGSVVPGLGNMVGAGVGAGIGALVGSVGTLIHDGPSFTDQMRQMSESVQGFGTAAQTAAGNITQLHAQVANLRLNRDALQQRIKSDRVAATQAPHSRVARDQLIADLAQLQAVDVQIGQANKQITAEDNKRTEALKKQHEAIAAVVTKTQNLGHVTELVSRAGIRIGMRVGDQFIDAKTKLQAYIQELTHLAQSVESSDPKLAETYYKLADIARETGKIPNSKKVRIVVDATYSKNAQELFKLFGLSKLGINLDAAFKDMFKGVRETTSKDNKGPQPLTRAQRIQIAFADNKYNRQTIEQEIAVDNSAIRRLKRQRDEGKINNLQYVNQVTAYYQDRQQMYDRLKTLDKKAKSGSSSATTAFDKKVTHDELLAKARLAIQNGQTAVAQELLRKDKHRLELLLREAKNADERIAVEKQLTAVEHAMKQKSSSFSLSLKLQEQMARADALAALDPSLQGPTALQIKLAEQAKAQAMKAIKSHTLTMEGLTAAWQIVGQANAVLAQQAGVQAQNYHHVSTDVIADSIKGLSRAQELQLRERLAQRDAHRGSAPNGAAADGYVVGDGQGGHPQHQSHHRPHHRGQPGPPHSNGTVVFDGAIFHITGVQNVRQLLAELEKLSRQKNHGRAGTRR